MYPIDKNEETLVKRPQPQGLSRAHRISKLGRALAPDLQELVRLLHQEPQGLGPWLEGLVPERRQRILLSLSPRLRQEVILLAPRPQDLVRALPEVELFRMIKAIGEASALPLIEMASPEQMAACLDLDIWRGDHVRLERLDDWVKVIMAASDRTFIHWVRGVDHEVLQLWFWGNARVQERDPEAVEEPEGFTLESIYYIDCRDEVMVSVVERALRLIKADDGEFYFALMQDLIHGLPSVTEEDALRWRGARLADLGFLSWEEAMEVYRPLTVEQALAMGGSRALPLEERPPHSLWSLEGATGLVEAALAELAGPEVERVAGEMVYLTSRMLVADKGDQFQLEQMDGGARRAGAMVNLGLEELVASSGEAPALLLEELPVVVFFRVAVGRVLKLVGWAQRLVRSHWIASEGSFLLDPEVRPVLQGLLRPRPELVMDETGIGRPFATLADVDLVSRALEEVEAQALLAEAVDLTAPFVRDIDLQGCSLASPRDLTMATILLTALCQGILGHPIAFAPLTARQVLELRERAFDEGGRLLPQVSQNIESLLISKGGPGVRRVIQRWLTSLEMEIGRLPRTRVPDPRFLGGVVVRL